MKKIILFLFTILSINAYAQVVPNTLTNFGAGFTIGTTISILNTNPTIGYNQGVIAGTVAGLIKETYDGISGNNYINLVDAITVSAGALIGSTIICELKKNKSNKRRFKRKAKKVNCNFF